MLHEKRRKTNRKIGKKILAGVLALGLAVSGLTIPSIDAQAATALKDGQAESYNSNQYYHIDILVNANYEYVLTFDKNNVEADHADIFIQKHWNVAEGTALPDKIQVNVNQAAGTSTSVAETVTLTAEDDWSVMLENMPLYTKSGSRIKYVVDEDSVSAEGYYETIVTEVESSLQEKEENVMVYTEGDKTITFYYDSTAPHINIDGTAYPYETANWVDNGDGTYSLKFTYTHPDTGLVYTSTWIYDSANQIYSYISDDYMVVDSIDYVTYISTSGVEKVLYAEDNYVPEVTAVTRDARDNEVARDYYYYVEQADAYRGDTHYSQEFWSTNRAIEDMPSDTVIRVGYDYTYGYYDKFGSWHSDSGVAEQIYDTGSDSFDNVCG